MSGILGIQELRKTMVLIIFLIPKIPLIPDYFKKRLQLKFKPIKYKSLLYFD